MTKTYTVTYTINTQGKNAALRALRAEASEMREIAETTSDVLARYELLYNTLQLEALADVLQKAKPEV